jgi:hypothetical protein
MWTTNDTRTRTIQTPRSSAAYDLLVALRAAGSYVWIDDDGDLMCTPPRHRVNWAGDVETALDELRDELKTLVQDERVTVH